MKKTTKKSRIREFSPKVRKEIIERDNGRCIFCAMDYHMEGATFLDLHCMSIMHYIPRSRNGLGVVKNGALGCQHHHNMLDNGNLGRRAEMLKLYREYLQRIYPDWKEDDLVYNKWRCFE